MLVSPTTAQADMTATHDAQTAVLAASMHFGGTLQQIIQDRAIQAIPVAHIAPDTRPGMQQPRFLPLPEQLVIDGQPVTEYQELVAELLTLGDSLKERQIQPIVIFPGTSNDYPQARYLILVGQRRWTAACLVGIPTLDAVVVDPPAPAERVHIQYVENEEREEFSDMERAWSLYQMKQALNDAPWEEVETRLQMSRARRQQLLRMMAFSPVQQRRVALLRLQETQARTLHSALRSGELTSAQVDDILERLHSILTQRSRSIPTDEPTEERTEQHFWRRSVIDGPTVARLVARARRQATTTATLAPPRWLPPLYEQIARTCQSLQRSLARLETLSVADVSSLDAKLSQLQTLTQQVRQHLQQIDIDGQSSK